MPKHGRKTAKPLHPETPQELKRELIRIYQMYDVSPAYVTRTGIRRPEIVAPRRHFLWVALQLGYSTYALNRWFGIHHTTILNAAARYTEIANAEPVTGFDLERKRARETKGSRPEWSRRNDRLTRRDHFRLSEHR